MTINSLAKEILVHELQLGEQLNESVHQERRSDFSLLLAMLTDDVRAHSQFTLPLTQDIEKTTSSEQLRQYFQLPSQAPLALDHIDNISAFNQASLIENQQLTDLKLLNTLTPKPIAFRDDAAHISEQVMSNTSLYCQQKHKNKAMQDTPERAKFNAKAWLNAVQTTITKAPLMEASA